MKRTYRWSELRKILRKHDSRFEFSDRRGKGSHAYIRHPDFKKPYTVPCPRGDKSVISKVYLNRIKKRFNLPDDLL